MCEDFKVCNTVKAETFDANLIRGFGKNGETVILEDLIFDDSPIFPETCMSEINIRGI